MSDSMDDKAKAQERQARRDQRTRRLWEAIASVKGRLEAMPLAMRSTEFVSRLRPPLPEAHMREIFQEFINMVDELQDAADAFMCFCDCKHGGDEDEDSSVSDPLNGWTSIFDKFPPLDEKVLVLDKEGRSAVAYRTDHNGGGYVSYSYYGLYPVWWRRIPAEPYGKVEEGESHG